MTAQAFADLLQGRRVGPGRWQARCPAHDDRSPSLSIRAGDDGRCLIWCFAGCALKAILASLGLAVRDLYDGPAISRARLKHLAAERARRDEEDSAARRLRRELSDQARQLASIVEATAGRLARLHDDHPDGETLTYLFHHAIARHRDVEMALEEANGNR